MKKETIIDVSKQFRNLQVQYEKVIKCHKQLQKELREETVESVRLKNQYDKVVEQNKSLQAELREQTAECEELKKEYEDILDSRQREWEEEYERYKQALDDIEVFCKTNDFYVDSTTYEIFKIIKEAKEGE